jgi:chemotaxis protein methyltransferase CheR
VQLSDASIQVLSRLLEARTGQHMAVSRHWRMASVLAALLRDRQADNLDQLVAMLASPSERALADKVVEALLNNETYFFRDRVPFDLIEQNVLPALAERNAANRRITIWSAGCSTGQEALSLAMMFADRPAQWGNWTIDILATDVSAHMIEVARRGCFSQFEIQRGLSMMQTISWFDETPDGWQAKPELLGKIRFQVHNLLNPLLGRHQFDIILCRNVLLYFNAANRARAFERLAGSLGPEGALLLGAGETVVGQTDRLEPDPAGIGLYRHAVAAARSTQPAYQRKCA